MLQGCWWNHFRLASYLLQSRHQLGTGAGIDINWLPVLAKTMAGHQHISLGEALGNNKVPPYWAPGCGTLFSDYLRDLEGWIRGTELQVPAQANAIYQRLGGTARMIARELPAAALAEGRDEEDIEERDRQNPAAIAAGYAVAYPPWYYWSERSPFWSTDIGSSISRCWLRLGYASQSNGSVARLGSFSPRTQRNRC